MRTKLSLDDDVTALLERVCKARGATMEEVINEALRRGLREIAALPASRRAFRTQSVDLGRCSIGNLDNVSEALARVEDDSFRRAD